MAISDEDRQQAERQLYEYGRRLRIREGQKTRLGDAADPSVDLELEDLRLNIAALKAILKPQLKPEVEGLVRSRIDDDNLFLFQQSIENNERTTVVEQRIERIEQTQHAAQIDRLAARDDRAAETVSRRSGQSTNRLLLSAVLFVVLLRSVVDIIGVAGRPILVVLLGYVVVAAVLGVALGRYLRWRS